MICSKCNSTFADNARFCPKCGTKVEENPTVSSILLKKCPKCGTENPSSAKFCKVDGYNFQEAEENAQKPDAVPEIISNVASVAKSEIKTETGTVSQGSEMNAITIEPSTEKANSSSDSFKDEVLKLYFYLNEQKNNIGPVTLDELQKLYKNGQIKSNTYVIQKGKKDWTILTKLLEISGASANSPQSTIAKGQSLEESAAEARIVGTAVIEQKGIKESFEQSKKEETGRVINFLIENILSSGEFTPEDMQQLKAKAEKTGFSEEQLLIDLENKLLEKGMIPDPEADIQEATSIEERLSVNWKTYDKHLESSINKFHSILEGLVKEAYNPIDYSKIASSATGFLRRDEFKIKETLISYLKEKGFKPVGEYETGNDLKVAWRTNSAIKPTPSSSPKFNLKFIMIGVASLFVLVAVSVSMYLFFFKKDNLPLAEQKISESVTAKPTQTPAQSSHDSARILALDALRAGTDLSVTISKIPKLVKVVEAAKELGQISPRYQEQVTSAENTLNSAQKNRDRDLMTYYGKVVELSRYTQEQISYAMGLINNGDLALREKKVIELLTKHIEYLQKNANGDPKTIMSDFNQQFDDYVD